MTRLCVIFDLDGTLVDSEGIGNQAFLDLLPDLADGVEALTERYRGLKLAVILDDLRSRLGRGLPEDFERHYRARVAELFTQSLRPIEGVPEMLAAVRYAKCVASSGPMAKIRHSLALCGLDHHFGDNVFSSYEMKSWKPDPGLFLHAAKAMGFSPSECVVIEDSEVGIAAAIAAGMTAMHFVPASGTRTLERISFNAMSQVPTLLVNHLAGR